MSKSKKHPKPDNKEAPVIVFASIVKDERGQFTLSLMPVSYLETRYGQEMLRQTPCKLPN